MRKNLLSFASGAIAMLLLIGLSVTALAANDAIKIEVRPIKVMVNGEIFQPKDSNGNDVMVFTYNGTTYAPLRALAEAYGLEVGYDAENRIATVNAKSAAGANPLEGGFCLWVKSPFANVIWRFSFCNTTPFFAFYKE